MNSMCNVCSLLNEYVDDEREFIVELGRFVYDEHKSYFQSSDGLVLDKWKELKMNKSLERELERRTAELEYQKDQYNEINNRMREMLENERERIEDAVLNRIKILKSESMLSDDSREKLLERTKEVEMWRERVSRLEREIEDNRENMRNDIEYYRGQIENLNSKMYEMNIKQSERIEDEVEKRTKDLREELKKAEDKNKYYYSLYEDKGKGKNFELDLYPKMERYNLEVLDSIWNIEHIGSSHKEKCDFHFTRKGSGEIILLDTKHNTATAPVSIIDMNKFIRDVTMKENGAIGGIMLASGRISKKRSFEINTIQGKTMIFVSNYREDYIPFLFELLEFMIESNRMKSEHMNEDEVKSTMKSEYNFNKERINNLELERKKYEVHLNEIRNMYMKMFNEDIEIELNGEKKVTNKAPTSSGVIDFVSLEKVQTIIGKRSKYYLKYIENNKKILQYFSASTFRNRKLTRLIEKKKNGELIEILE